MAMSIRTYSPQISPGNDGVTPFSETVPATTLVGTITFTYPYVDPTLTVVLRAPEFNDIHSIHLSRITRKSRGQSLRVFRNPIWPKTEILSFSINTLSADDVENIRTLIVQSLGKEVGYLDWESRQWKVLIVNPGTAIEVNGRCKSYSVRLELQGVLV